MLRHQARGALVRANVFVTVYYKVLSSSMTTVRVSFRARIRAGMACDNPTHSRTPCETIFCSFLYLDNLARSTAESNPRWGLVPEGSHSMRRPIPNCLKEPPPPIVHTRFSQKSSFGGFYGFSACTPSTVPSFLTQRKATRQMRPSKAILFSLNSFGFWGLFSPPSKVLNQF